jgi:8-oxo-dGTP pyrophosphatase MutT (NUDIX family)
LRQRLCSASPIGERGDHDLNPGMRAAETIHPAAVLVPLIDRPGGTTVLLTRRTEHLAHHAGQISFPGGRMEPGDATPEHAALREAQEEIGLAPTQVEVLGRLCLYRTRTGFAVTPVVGIVRPPFAVEPDPEEVADVFEVPLAFVVDPTNLERHSRDWHGQRRYYFVLPYADYYIWGATAGMLVDLAERLRE